MKNCVITFRSVTPAQRAEALLRREGFACRLQRTPRWMAEQGCGYSLQVRLADAESCVQLLKRGNIPMRKVYLMQEGGAAEELAL